MAETLGGMERRTTTRPGLLQWTPAPLRTSEDSREDEDEEEDEFNEQMDENGIIGLSEALQNWDWGKPGGYSDPGSPEDAAPSGGVQDLKSENRQAFAVPWIEEDEEERLPDSSGGRKDVDGLTYNYWLNDVEAAENSEHGRLVSEPAVTASHLPHLYRFTEEELAAAPGIQAETFPDMSLTETDSYCSLASVKSSTRRPETQLRASRQPDVPEEHKASESPGASDSRTRSVGGAKDSPESRQPSRGHDRTQRTPRARNTATGLDASRRASLTHQTPNFSKVEPRVNFPKHGYKPPKRKQALTRISLSPEAPVVFKSPADIVKEVLFNTDGCSASSDSDTPTNAPTSTVPPGFRCRQQATSLLHQLQEDYDRLLTKYAEAENTIDRLRLEAKVNLTSDPPQAGHSVPSRLSHNASNLISVDFCQAQRAEISSAGQSSHQENPDAGSPPSQLGQQLSIVLSSQAEKFLQQLQTFDDLLKMDTFTSFEKSKGLSQLSEGLNSLERGYLLARDEHKLLEQRGVETCHFDPERELEGLVFQCGQRMEELKEQVEQNQPEQHSSVAFFPSSPPPGTSSPDPPGGGQAAQNHQQTPSELFQIDSDAAAEQEVRSAGKETLKSLYFRPLDSRDRCVEHKETELLDHSQTLKEHFRLPKAPSSVSLNTALKHGGEEEEQKGRSNGNDTTQEPFSQRKVESDPDSLRCSRTIRPSCSPSSMPLAQSGRSRRRLEKRRSPSSSRSSLTDVAAEQRSSKLPMGSRRGQDRIISPETDSGFVGSESSRLTPGAVPILHQQRASDSVSAPQDRNTKRPQSASLSVSHLDPELTDGLTLNSSQRRRSRQRRRTFSHSPQSCVSQKNQSRAADRSNDLWSRSDFYSSTSQAPSASEEQRSISLAESVASSLGSHSTSAPAARHCHGDPMRVPNSSHGSNQEDTLTTLQAEVERLKEKLDFTLRNEALPSAMERCSHRSNSSTPNRECCIDVSLGRRSAQAADEIEQDSVFSKTSRETSASTPKREQQRHVLRRSAPEEPRSRVSRCTQTSAAGHSRSSVERCNRNTQTWRSSAPGAADEPDSKDQSPVCPQCSSVIRKPAERPHGGSREPPESPHCCHCAIFGRLKCHECTESDSYRHYLSNHLNHQAADSPDRASTRSFSAALQDAPWYPPHLLLPSTPLRRSPEHITASGTRRSRERRGRSRRSLSADRPRSLDGSLVRAIRAARHMKNTSRHMARSLASGLQNQRLLTQSCSS